MRTIADIFPDARIPMEIEPAELAAVIMEIWEEAEESSRNDMRTMLHFINPLYTPGDRSSYPHPTHENIELAVAEAWSWMHREGLIIQVPGQPSQWYQRTRRGKTLKTRVDVEAYRSASLLPRSLLHPVIDEKCWNLFLRGDYEVAVLQAFKSVEVAVRTASAFPDNLLGVQLMRRAFHPEQGPLTDKEVVIGEREALLALFAGAIGHAKNPQSHRDRPINIVEGAQLLLFASYLMGVVELRSILT